jgi:glycosyltransferase involved in cell wall biosynthesis
MKELRDRDHEVFCVYSSWNDGEFRKLLEDESIPSVSMPLGFISKKLSWTTAGMTLDQFRRVPSLWFKYRKVLSDFKPTIVVHTNFHHLILLWPLLRAANNVFHVHECFPSSKFYRVVLKLISLRLKLFVGVSKFVATSLMSLGIPEEKISYVLNGVSSNSSCQLETEAISSRSDSSPVTIGIIGQVGEWKGHDDLVEALCLLKREGVKFVCRIFGGGDPLYVDSLKEKISSRGLVQEVEWSGFVRNKCSIYSCIDLCVVPTRSSEPFGLVAAEASLHGIPVVATKCGGLPEIIIDEKTGYLIDAGSSAALAHKLKVLIQSSTLRHELGVSARQHALKNLTSGRMVNQFDKALYSLVS